MFNGGWNEGNKFSDWERFSSNFILKYTKDNSSVGRVSEIDKMHYQIK